MLLTEYLLLAIESKLMQDDQKRHCDNDSAANETISTTKTGGSHGYVTSSVSETSNDFMNSYEEQMCRYNAVLSASLNS
jgi:hypothetical protein